MLLKSYKKSIFRSKCNSTAMKVHCHVELEQDVSNALPYLNAVLGGDSYTMEPPSVTFRASGKLITVHGKLIAINALEDEEEADKIIGWLQREINQAWEKRDAITPSYQSAPKPQLIEVFKRLPKTNCGKCDEATCMVFAARVTEGAKTHHQCPDLGHQEKQQIDAYLAQFNLPG